ncbi:SCP-2 sterol transfer family protein [Alkalispirochaeta americana]|uniref:SCP-2 sterol transfer family protein n=1 Tax=Alkalispirochaeta americana TaxID=159291 RepID=A0A1N6SMV6_9SPIO|nr:NAD(P)H-dependent oxidoreductase [Alkalispirochaeta americana]SIQ42399.1 SCP-2 sterol transfer family protein [Alkalispirochaeta americana]
MNILLLNGSPRGEQSISLSLSRHFLEGLQSRRDQLGEAPASIKEVHVVEADIQSCRGCFACWQNGGICVIKDDMADLLPAYRQADLILWSMPLYHFGMPAIMKKCVERTLPELQGTIIPDGDGGFSHPVRASKPATKGMPRNLLVSTCGFPSTRNNYEPLHAHLDLLLGRDQWEKIECVQAELLKVPELRSLGDAYYGTVRQAGEEWAQALFEEKAWAGFSPDLRNQLETPLMEPERFLRLANASWSSPGHDETGGPSPEERAEILLNQMSLMYNTSKAPPRRTILEMNFQDLQRSFYLVMDKTSCTVADSPEDLNLEDGKSDCTITTDASLWAAIARGELDGTEALITGRYKVTGDTSLIIRMGDGLFDGSSESAIGPQEGKGRGGAPKNPSGNPLFLGLLPWILCWVFLPLGHVLDHNLVLLLALVLSNGILWMSGRNNRATWYEYTNPLILGLLLGVSLVFPDFFPKAGVVPMYLAASAQWALSCLQRPLTSDYSGRSYSPAIVASPLFRQTNQIMTLFWAGVYMLIALFVLALDQSLLRPFSGLIVQVLLVPAMVFTRWFPRWYSERSFSG